MEKFEELNKMFNKILTQVKSGVVKIGEWKFYVQLDVENLKFKGKSLFENNEMCDIVEQYLSKAREFYNADKEYYELNDFSFDEKLILDLFVNMSNYDMENVEKYLTQRIEMLKEENNILLEKTTVGTIQDADIQVCIMKNPSNLEAPFRFRTIIKRDNEKFILPDISFAKIDDCLHVYALQMKREKQDNSTAKKFDRYFRKLNKGIDVEDEVLSQVSPNALASLTVCLSYFKQMGIEKLEAHGFMPIRYNSKEETGKLRFKTQEELSEFLDKNDRNQFNITNKFYNTILRYAHHFGLNTHFDEIQECLKMELKENQKTNDNNIIYDLDREINQNLQIETNEI